MRRTVAAINERIQNGDAVVMTALEVQDLIDQGGRRELEEVDVVTTGTMGLMSGIYGLFSFPVAPPGAHMRFVEASIMGIPLHLGPCTNERLGLIEGMVFGTSKSRDHPDYGAGHLFRDLVEREEVTVEAISDAGEKVLSSVTLGEMGTARLLSTRAAFRNYRAFVNPSPAPVRTIFSSRPLPGRSGGLTFSGCGSLNPLESDPRLRTVGVGTRLLFNGAVGYVMASGTRSTPANPNLMAVAEMKGMSPSYLGGFLTSAGPECIASFALPIPVLDEEVMAGLGRRDRDLSLPVADITDRRVVGTASYGEAWEGRDLQIEVRPDRCKGCRECAVESACPTRAMRRENGPVLDRERCFNCGTCVKLCPGGAFVGDLGSVDIITEGDSRRVPVVCRQSNRWGALRAAEDLKARIQRSEFLLTSKVADLHP